MRNLILIHRMIPASVERSTWPLNTKTCIVFNLIYEKLSSMIQWSQFTRMMTRKVKSGHLHDTDAWLWRTSIERLTLYHICHYRFYGIMKVSRFQYLSNMRDNHRDAWGLSAELQMLQRAGFHTAPYRNQPSCSVKFKVKANKFQRKIECHANNFLCK